MHRMSVDQYACFLDLEPQLAQAGVRRLRPGDLNERQKQFVAQFFQDEIASVLTPMGVVSGPGFPLLGNQMLHVAVRLNPPPGEAAMRFAIIPLGRSLGRFVTLPSERGSSLILLEDVVAMHVDRFFPGESIAHCAAFRITRNADLSIRDDIAHDLMAEIEEILDERKLGDCVRLELAADADPQTVAFLSQKSPSGSKRATFTRFPVRWIWLPSCGWPTWMALTILNTSPGRHEFRLMSIWERGCSTSSPAKTCC